MITGSEHKVEKKKTSYLIPRDLARRIRREAADSDRWPADVVVAACETYLSKPQRSRSREQVLTG